MGRALSTYLKDHYAGSTGGVTLARDIAEGSDDEAERREMEAIAAEIEDERGRLLAITRELGGGPSRVKQIGAFIGEKASRAKLRASSSEGRVLQYESLIMGVTGKLQLWRSLAERRPAGVSFEEIRQLAAKAESQRSRLEALHARAAQRL